MRAAMLAGGLVVQGPAGGGLRRGWVDGGEGVLRDRLGGGDCEEAGEEAASLLLFYVWIMG